MKHISEIEQPITVEKVVEVVKNEGFVSDDYHALVVEGATRLHDNGLDTFEYQTGWRTSTLWKDPHSGGTVVVRANGQIS